MQLASSGSRNDDGAVDLAAVDDGLRGGAVAIGNFDGVHRGHQRVLRRALSAGRPAVALTFEPHPRAYFSGRPVFRLTDAAQKARIVAALGLDATIVAGFDGAFAALGAEDFIERVLVASLGARSVIVGADFSFGAKRSGSVATLNEAGARAGFAVEVVDFAADEGGEIISSSRVRERLAEGDVVAAAALLGYRYAVRATVRHGEKRGRTMGYPTLNQALDPANRLRHGIYAVRVKIDDDWRPGVASFGRRPTFDNGAPLLETFVFDYSGELYGRDLDVAFVRFLRPEMKFSGMDALIAQMDADSAAARAALAEVAPLSELDAALNF